MTSESDDIPVADPDELLEFWEAARERVGLGRIAIVTGAGASASVPAPSWAFGDSPAVADALLELVLSGAKTATASALWEYEDGAEPLPVPGDLSIVLDGGGRPRALIRTVRVETVPFSDVDAEHAFLEGEGDRSLEAWRTVHESVFRRRMAGRSPGFTPEMGVVLERFEVRYPTGVSRPDTE